jgi:hypothetical protein
MVRTEFRLHITWFDAPVFPLPSLPAGIALIAHLLSSLELIIAAAALMI